MTTKTEKYRIERNRNLSTHLDVPLDALHGAVYDSWDEAEAALPEGLVQGPAWIDAGSDLVMWYYPEETTEEEMDQDIYGALVLAKIVQYTAKRRAGVRVSWDSGMTEEYDSIEEFEESLDGTSYYTESDLRGHGVRETRIMEDDDLGVSHPVGLAERD